MTAIATTIVHEDSCPDVTVNNTTVYPSNSTHSRSNFTQYVKYSLQLPNGITITFSQTGYPNQVLPPAQSLSIEFETCLDGKYTATYSALPTPPDSVVVGQGTEYEVNDNFYYAGVIYNVKTPGFVNIPSEGFTNAQLITSYLAVNAIEIIEESEINSKYISEIDFNSWCTLNKCLKDKIEKLCCLVVKEPTRNDLCEMKLYEEVLQLNFIKYLVDNDLLPDQTTEQSSYTLKSAGNYINSICCCKDCKDC